MDTTSSSGALAGDALFVLALLAGSACVVAMGLWVAHAAQVCQWLSTPRRTTLRAGLGVLVVGVCVSLMLGLLPGSTLVANPWTLAACFSCGLLGMGTLASALRDRGTGSASAPDVLATLQTGTATSATRKAA